MTAKKEREGRSTIDTLPYHSEISLDPSTSAHRASAQDDTIKSARSPILHPAAFSSYNFSKTFIITTDAGTESGRTFPCIFFQNPTALSSHFPRIPFRLPQAFPTPFYYFSHYDQNASYRASL